ncbi:hypothetical protein [Sediminicola luteus]|uniref:Coenzyme Q-binding protein COQ10 START domain-containing protein n=1 Tax=Sediminicola luteus TaxID=319238 RepID=A0ABV2TY60_9FLAO
MTKVKFYPSIYQTIPYSFDMVDQWNAEGKRIKDLVLKNNMATKQGVSEMTLNIIKLSATDKAGKEHFIEDFPSLANLTIKGLHTGHFLRSKSALELNPGEYTSFRFYLEKAGNSFVYSDRSSKPVSRFDSLDFEIEGGLQIHGDEAKEVILRFDFEPYALPQFLLKTKQLFKSFKWFVTQLVHSMEHKRIKI